VTITANGRPRINVALRSGQRETNLRIRVSWSFRLSGPVAARLLVVAALILAAAAIVLSASDGLARDVMCSLAGFLAGSRPRTRS
jgi:hypothetical protein